MHLLAFSLLFTSALSIPQTPSISGPGSLSFLDSTPPPPSADDPSTHTLKLLREFEGDGSSIDITTPYVFPSASRGNETMGVQEQRALIRACTDLDFSGKCAEYYTNGLPTGCIAFPDYMCYRMTSVAIMCNTKCIFYECVSFSLLEETRIDERAEFQIAREQRSRPMGLSLKISDRSSGMTGLWVSGVRPPE
jgi:hypothetical protein